MIGGVAEVCPLLMGGLKAIFAKSLGCFFQIIKEGFGIVRLRDQGSGINDGGMELVGKEANTSTLSLALASDA